MGVKSNSVDLSYDMVRRETSTQKHPLGTRGATGDGKVFYYAKLGASAVLAGKLLQSMVQVANNRTALAVLVAAAGVTSITVTLGATAIVVDEYKGGFVIVEEGGGAGQTLKIKSHPAAAASANVVLTLEAPLVTAFVAATTKVGLKFNPYRNVIVFPTAITGYPVGLTTFDVTASYFFWAQTWGNATALVDGTVVGGNDGIASDAVAGAIEARVDASIRTSVGTWAVPILADTKYGEIDLHIRA